MFLWEMANVENYNNNDETLLYKIMCLQLCMLKENNSNR